MIFLTTDIFNKQVGLKKSTWEEHILPGHPDLETKVHVIKQAIEDPILVLPNEHYDTRLNYFGMLYNYGKYRIKVIVEMSYTSEPSYIVTSHIIDKKAIKINQGIIYEKK